MAEKEYLLVEMVFVTISTIRTSVKEVDVCITQPTEIPYAIAPLGNTLSLRIRMIASLSLPKVQKQQKFICLLSIHISLDLYKGPCPQDKVVSVSSSGELECGSNTCPSLDRYYQDFLLQLVPAKESKIIGSDDDDDGYCYALGTRGPCSPYELFGYNIFRAEGQCLNTEDPTTPYFSSPEENDILDELYNHTSEEPAKKSVTFFRSQHLSRNRRQSSFGIIQQTSSIPTSLLNPCQLGNRNGINFKCTNPLV